MKQNLMEIYECNILLLESNTLYWLTSRKAYIISIDIINVVFVNLRKQLSPGQRLESETAVITAGALPTALPRRITGPSQNFSLI